MTEPTAPGTPPRGKLTVTLWVITALGFVALSVVLAYAFKLWSAFEVPSEATIKASGCDLMQVAPLEGLSDATAKSSGAEAIVMCLMAPEKKHPTCEQVAKAYGANTERAAPRYIVVVGILGDDRTPPSCSGVYTPRGERVGDTPKIPKS